MPANQKGPNCSSYNLFGALVQPWFFVIFICRAMCRQPQVSYEASNAMASTADSAAAAVDGKVGGDGGEEEGCCGWGRG